jgi:2-polyprenyl-6-methoxyphenol hydroxylase-like FAD-dependent oxidoreductase
MKSSDAAPPLAPLPSRVDLVIVGGGLAGQTLARQTLLQTGRTVLLLERLPALPPARQKVGESTVQLAGYYFSRVLDLEEHLLRSHFLKYNLRFYWPSQGRTNEAFEDLSQGYIRDFSNVCSYQVDRNVLEGELFRLNGEDPRFASCLGVTELELALSAGGADHRVAFTCAGVRHEVAAGWVVDTTGRTKSVAKKRALVRESPIEHGTFFWWVDGLVDVERLTDQTLRERRLSRRRRKTGHAPSWLATNHFVGEGFWFWVIPLQGKTSLGLVFDRARVRFEDVNKPEKATAWLCERFPLLARDLPQRQVLGSSGYVDYAHDCAQTLSADRWALSGEAGRFSDPLYSPGSDLIAIYNTLIVDCLETADPEELAAKVRLYEQVEKAVYSAYLPTYVDGYDVLGDPEAFSMKYSWELAVYFVFYVFPFLNDLFTDRRFLVSYLRAFAKLGPINAGLQKLLLGYYHWRKEHVGLPQEPVLFDFNDVGPLMKARTTFYRVGVTTEEARAVLDEQLDHLGELARFVYARVASVVLGEPAVLRHAAFVRAIDPAALRFDEAELAARWQAAQGEPGLHAWRFDASVIEVFPAARAVPVAALEEVEA